MILGVNEATHLALEAADRRRPPLPEVDPAYHWLLHLPPAFWSGLGRYLTYHEMLSLAALSSEFARTRVEGYLSWEVRNAFVAQRERALGSSEQRCACYLCFRIVDVAAFAVSAEMHTHARVLRRAPYTGQRILEPVPAPSSAATSTATSASSPPPPPSLHRLWMPSAPGAELGQTETLRRYCINCALATHLAVPHDVFVNRIGVRHWVCKCAVAHPQTSGEDCKDCGMQPIYHI